MELESNKQQKALTVTVRAFVYGVIAYPLIQ
ncbi:hypothetical protein SAMN05518847_106185 [Paenibacillus sp. OV219]|nr:hypothetical protein SAMN05518847_106185 [Paenibacillus sp. OV219]